MGFNRRFSPHSEKMKSLIGDSVINAIVTVNAGKVARELWVNDREVGGGRILGEACHFIDLITFLAGSAVTAVCMNAMEESSQSQVQNGSILLRYENGSTGVINYFANGHQSYSKERVEVYFSGRTLILDDFCVLKGYGCKKFTQLKTSREKGHRQQFQLLQERLRTGGAPLIAFSELLNTTHATFAAMESLTHGGWVAVP